ncbi:hypothetical protein J5N97_018393 [Dioscorea zingiberensis]|uniref:RNA helicase n=1 Tax=Dioscorea zingiberensis TaxID=325984 RepID=A0A9D5HHB7_9LILI|nr:hypothetical protein J5N97_018393 [Dioscorea zingiberensis]
MATDEKTEMNPVNGKPYSRRYRKLLEKRKQLPIWALKDRFLDALAKHQIVVVAAGTGSGKSTQIPQFIIEAGYASNGKKVVCVEPRRLVATAISCRVAQEMGVIIGEEVGYSVQFEDCRGPKTTLMYLTDGTLLRELLADQVLQSYGVIVLDEAHLRTLATDLLLGFLKRLIDRNSRPDLKLVIMSTQQEAKWFKDYFKGARIVQIEGSLHPVEIIHTTEPIKDYLGAAIEKVLEILTSEPTGDILVFLPGGDDIEAGSWRLTGLLKDRTDEFGPVRILPLHSMLPLELQKKIFKAAPPSIRKGGPVGRKVIMSTDIADSSLAIDGIAYVIDSGFSKQKVYNAGLHVESLLVLPISRASAYRRSGCCRRSVPGKCYRLYTKKFLDDCQQHASPEILRANLTGTVLLLKRLGISDMLHFDFINPPGVDMMASAVETLNCLGALDGDGNLTAVGELMSEFPLDPPMSKMILHSPEFKCSNEILAIISMLSVPHCFLRPREKQHDADKAKAIFSHASGDHLTLLNVYQAYKKQNGSPAWCEENFINQAAMKSADNVRSKLKSIMCKFNIKLCSTDSSSCDYDDNIRKALVAGYFMQAAKLNTSGHYMTVKYQHIVDLHPSNSLVSKPAWVIYNDFVFASRPSIRIVTDVRGEWLVDIAPHYYQISPIGHN